MADIAVALQTGTRNHTSFPSLPAGTVDELFHVANTRTSADLAEWLKAIGVGSVSASEVGSRILHFLSKKFRHLAFISSVLCEIPWSHDKRLIFFFV